MKYLHSLRTKIILWLVLMVTVSLGLYQTYLYNSLKTRLTHELSDGSDQKISRLVRDFNLPMWELDDVWINTIIETEMRDPQVYALFVYENNTIIAAKKRDSHGKILKVTTDHLHGDFLQRRGIIEHDGRKIGGIKIYLSKTLINKRLSEELYKAVLLTLLVSILISLSLGYMINLLIIRPINLLLASTQQIALGEYNEAIILFSDNEIGLLGTSIDVMKTKIQTREYELRQSMEELEQQRQALIDANEMLEVKVKERTADLIEANEKLKELDKLKSMFIASMSHELRTPLNSIIGFAGVLLQGMSGPINEKQTDQLRRVKSAGQHLLSLISDVIDISKIEAGRVTPFPEYFFLNDLLQEAFGETEILAKQKGLEFEIESIPVIEMFSDKKRLYQCLLNYLSNAVKFTDTGKVVLGASNEDGTVKIWVKDTGAGIAEKDKPRLFEAFERFETHLRVIPGGTGLGLYLTRKITETLLQGSVWVESKEEEGSVFGLSIPQKIKVEEEQR
jgi:signal transduction histidine kinase